MKTLKILLVTALILYVGKMDMEDRELVSKVTKTDTLFAYVK